MESLPEDVVLLVFEQLEDTIDAESLSQSARRLYQLFSQYRRSILRAIISHSSTYRENVLLAHMLRENETLQGLLARKAPRAELPDETAVYECYRKATEGEAGLSDDFVQRVCRQDRLTAALSRRYLRALGELDDFHREKWGQSLPNWCVALGERSRAAGAPHGYTLPPDFRLQFRRAVCAVSLGVVSILQGRCSNLPEAQVLNDISGRARNLSRMKCHLYVKSPEPSAQEIRQFIEVWDFLYLFLLPRTTPFHLRNIWWSTDAEGGFDDPAIDSTENWDYYLTVCRLSLTPFDLLQLAVGQDRKGVANHPPDKLEYLKSHGLSWVPSENQGDWFSFFDRYAMLNDLGPTLTLAPTMPAFYSRSTASTWWDKERRDARSPFTLPEQPTV